MSDSTTYQAGFADGLRAAVDLVRAGAGDDLGLLLDDDPGQIDPARYQAHLAELRKALGTDSLFSRATT